MIACEKLLKLSNDKFVSVWNDALPVGRLCFKEESFDSNVVQPMLLRVLSRVSLLSLNLGEWRKKWAVDSVSKSQLQSGLKQV